MEATATRMIDIPREYLDLDKKAPGDLIRRRLRLALREELTDILFEDDTQRFVSLINRQIKEDGRLMLDDYTVWPVQSGIVHQICSCCAVECATLLMNGETPLKVDLNIPDETGCYPLHWAAEFGDANARIIELLISCGARTDIRYEGKIKAWHGKLPLQICLESSGFAIVRMWNDDSNEYEPTSMLLYKQRTRQSLFMLVAILCLPRMEVPLEKLRLLASSTKETEELFLHYVRHGELVNVAILLAAAHKKLTSKDLLSDADKNTDIRQLLNVFERLGDAIDAYRKQEREGGAFEETIDFTLNLLEQAGFVLDREDVDLTIYEWVKFDMDWEWSHGACAVTGKEFKHPKERPFFLKPGEIYDYSRVDAPWLFDHAASNQKMEEKGDAGAASSIFASVLNRAGDWWRRRRLISKPSNLEWWTNTSSNMPSNVMWATLLSKPWLGGLVSFSKRMVRR